MTENVSTEQLRFFLAFDHRGLFQRGLFGWDGDLSTEQAAKVCDAKQVIYEGVLVAAERAGQASAIGLLVDEQFGSAIASDAVGRGFSVAMPVERSDGDEFDFEFGAEFGDHIERFNPTYAKVLVRYNPDGDAKLNERQLSRLRALSDWLQARDRQFLFELIVPPTDAQLEAADDDRISFELNQRPALILRSMTGILDADIAVDVWKLEGLDDAEDANRAAELATANGRTDVELVLLGAGAGDERVIRWIEAAAPTTNWIGFAIGRSIWWAPLTEFLAGDLTRAEAAAQIADRYEQFVAAWLDARSS